MKSFVIAAIMLISLAGCGQSSETQAPMSPRVAQAMQVRNALIKIRMESSALCTNHDFAPYFERTACVAEKITDKQLANERTITYDEKLLMKKVIARSDEIEKEEDTLMKAYGGPVGARIVEYKVANYLPQREKNNDDLYNERISWGEFNHKRQALAQDLEDGLKKINPPPPPKQLAPTQEKPQEKSPVEPQLQQ